VSGCFSAPETRRALGVRRGRPCDAWLVGGAQRDGEPVARRAVRGSDKSRQREDGQRAAVAVRTGAGRLEMKGVRLSEPGARCQVSSRCGAAAERAGVSSRSSNTQTRGRSGAEVHAKGRPLAGGARRAASGTVQGANTVCSGSAACAAFHLVRPTRGRAPQLAQLAGISALPAPPRSWHCAAPAIGQPCIRIAAVPVLRCGCTWFCGLP
jgi:hypothetical protein